MTLLRILIFIEILICLHTLFQYYRQPYLRRHAFHQTVVILHFFFIFHLVWVLISKIYFPAGGWIENSAPFGLFYGPAFYFLTYTYTRGQWPSRSSAWHGVPYFSFLIFQIFLLVWGVDMESSTAGMYMRTLYFLIPVSFFTYGFWGLRILRNSRVRLRFTFNLFSFVTIFGLLVVGMVMLNEVVVDSTILRDGMENDQDSFIVYALFFPLMVILNRYAFRLMRVEDEVEPMIHTPIVKNMEEKSESVESSDNLRYEKSRLTEAEIDRYDHLIEAYMHHKKPWLNPQFSLQELSAELNIPQNQLSQFFNIHKEISYSEYINGLRIAYACELMEKSSGKRPFQDIAFESGFNSKATFYRWFKRIKGLTPTEYLDEME